MEQYRKEARTNVKNNTNKKAKKLRATTFALSKFEVKRVKSNNFCYRKAVAAINIWEAIEKR